MRLRNGLLAAVLAAAAFPAAAVAAPDHTTELSADKTSFAWTGAGSGVPIDAVGELGHDSPVGCDTSAHDCDYVLLDVKHPGALKINAAADGAQGVDAGVFAFHYPDIDLYLYKANPDGTRVDDEDLASTDCASGNIAEACEVKDLAAGYYLILVKFFLADEATYKADVTLDTPVPPTPAGAVEQPKPAEPSSTPPSSQPSQPAPASQPQSKPAPAKKKASKKKACQKKAKKIKNKAKRKKALKKCAKIKG